MQIEEIDRHHPSTLIPGDEPTAIKDQSLRQDGTDSEGRTGLGLDISSLDLSGSEKQSVSPVAEVPGPLGPGSDRRFSAGNRAFEEQALAVYPLLVVIGISWLMVRHCAASAVTPKWLVLMCVAWVKPNTNVQWVITFLEVSREERIK